ncbi:SRPBCC family protein [Edaphobacter paludis]|uniref:SRPBCC family protein n=1 Tax=Edaphobacter paludis TaxID=3035702 RepID=A0AAU7DD21_9BACT
MTLATEAGTEKHFVNPALLTIIFDIEASSDRVFTVLCNVERWPEWTSTMSSVRRIDDGPLSVGSRAQVRQPGLRPAIWQVTEMEPGRSFSWATRSPGVHVTGRHLIEKRGASSRVTLSIEFAGLLGPVVSRLFRKMNERYLTTEAESLKTRSES